MSVRLKKTKRQNSTDQQGVPTEATTNVNEPLLQQKVNVKIVKSNIKKVHPTNTDSSKPWLVKQLSNVGPSQHGNYLQNIKVHRNSVMYRGAILNTKKYRLRASSCPDIFRNSMITLPREEEEVCIIQISISIRLEFSTLIRPLTETYMVYVLKHTSFFMIAFCRCRLNKRE